MTLVIFRGQWSFFAGQWSFFMGNGHFSWAVVIFRGQLAIFLGNGQFSWAMVIFRGQVVIFSCAIGYFRWQKAMVIFFCGQRSEGQQEIFTGNGQTPPPSGKWSPSKRSTPSPGSWEMVIPPRVREMVRSEKRSREICFALYEVICLDVVGFFGRCWSLDSSRSNG